MQDFTLRTSLGVTTSLATMLTWAQQALAGTPRVPDPKQLFERYEALKSGGASPTRLHDWVMDQVPRWQDEGAQIEPTLDLAAAAHDAEVNAIPWGSIAIVVAVLLVARMIVHYPRWMSSIRARSLVGGNLARRSEVYTKALSSSRFTAQELYGMPVWRLANVGDFTYDGTWLAFLPEHTDPTALGSLPEVMAKHGYEVIAVGARGFQVNEPGIKQGATGSRTYEKALALGMPKVVSELLSDHTRSGRSKIVMSGEGLVGNFSLGIALNQLTPLQKTTMKAAYAIDLPGLPKESLWRRFMSRPLGVLFRRYTKQVAYKKETLQAGTNISGSVPLSTEASLARQAKRFGKQKALKNPAIPVTVVWSTFGTPLGTRAFFEQYLPSDRYRFIPPRGSDDGAIDSDRLVLANLGRGGRDLMAQFRKDLGLSVVG